MPALINRGFRCSGRKVLPGNLPKHLHSLQCHDGVGEESLSRNEAGAEAVGGTMKDGILGKTELPWAPAKVQGPTSEQDGKQKRNTSEGLHEKNSNHSGLRAGGFEVAPFQGSTASRWIGLFCI